jgi:hypothetical protein
VLLGTGGGMYANGLIVGLELIHQTNEEKMRKKLKKKGLAAEHKQIQVVPLKFNSSTKKLNFKRKVDLLINELVTKFSAGTK